MWQDSGFLGGGILLTFLLILTIVSKKKMPLMYTVPTAVVMLEFAVLFWTLGAIFSCIVHLVAMSGWIYMALFRRA